MRSGSPDLGPELRPAWTGRMYPTENRLRKSRSPELAFCGPFGDSLDSELPPLNIGSAVNKCFIAALYATGRSLAIRCNPYGASSSVLPTRGAALFASAAEFVHGAQTVASAVSMVNPLFSQTAWVCSA